MPGPERTRQRRKCTPGLPGHNHTVYSASCKFLFYIKKNLLKKILMNSKSEMCLCVTSETQQCNKCNKMLLSLLWERLVFCKLEKNKSQLSARQLCFTCFIAQDIELFCQGTQMSTPFSFHIGLQMGTSLWLQDEAVYMQQSRRYSY